VPARFRPTALSAAPGRWVYLAETGLPFPPPAAIGDEARNVVAMYEAGCAPAGAGLVATWLFGVNSGIVAPEEPGHCTARISVVGSASAGLPASLFTRRSVMRRRWRSGGCRARRASRRSRKDDRWAARGTLPVLRAADDPGGGHPSDAMLLRRAGIPVRTARATDVLRLWRGSLRRKLGMIPTTETEAASHRNN
jgi:hypothetical protein